ncbi:hypothetical protein [Acinetobacter sp.]|uniref:hypothetical protein n=1 Tax=Acinetobacter sp. TaxID=472 RepID=UPI002590CA5B|nr:hypothetical protein [Acinetobacter sp.]
MNKILFVIGCVVSLNCFANNDAQLLQQQMSVLKNLGGDNAELMDTMARMQKDFADDDESEGSIKLQAKPSHFKTLGQSDKASCSTNEVQLDTICQAAMLRYQAYLSAIAANESEKNIETLYSQHQQATEHYIQVYQALSR